MKNRARVVIVDDDPATRIDLKMRVENEKMKVVGLAGNSRDAINICEKERPNIVLIDIGLSKLEGLEVSEIIKKEKYAKEVIIITELFDEKYIEIAKKNNIFSYLEKPVSQKTLKPALELAYKRSEELSNLEEKIVLLQNELIIRRNIDQAKCRIMENEQLTEKDAYKYIRKMSMDKRCSMQDISMAIIQNYE